MANEERVRGNFIAGTVDNNPLASDGTTLNADELADLEAISATEHAVIVLDPDGSGNGPEIVYVTAHTAAATSATIVRAREGTTAVEHAAATEWVHGPVASDWPQQIASSAERPSTGGLPYPGMLCYEIDLHRYVYYDHDAALWLPAAGQIPAFRLGRTITQVIPEGAWTAVGMNSEGYDTDGMHTGSAATVTINTPGMWHFDAFVEYVNNDDAISPRGIRIKASDGQVAGASFTAENSSSVFGAAPACSGDMALADGVTVQVETYHHGSDLGLNLNNSIYSGHFAVFSGHWLGPVA